MAMKFCALDLNFQRCDRQLEVTFVHCCLQLYVTCSNINAKQTGTFVSRGTVGRFENLQGQIAIQDLLKEKVLLLKQTTLMAYTSSNPVTRKILFFIDNSIANISFYALSLPKLNFLYYMRGGAPPTHGSDGSVSGKQRKQKEEIKREI